MTRKSIPKIRQMIVEGNGLQPIPGVMEIVDASLHGSYGIPYNHRRIINIRTAKIAILASDGSWYGVPTAHLTNADFGLWLESINWTIPTEKPKTFWDSNEIFSLFFLSMKEIFLESFDLTLKVSDRILSLSFWQKLSVYISSTYFSARGLWYHLQQSLGNCPIPLLDTPIRECQRAMKGGPLAMNLDEINSFLFFSFRQ